jgi:hypothetical protein
MHPHAQHFAPAPSRARKAVLTPLRIGAALLVVVMLGGHALVERLIPEGEAASVTPIPLSHIETTPLPAVDLLRDTPARLRLWRAGYEAAVDNGCKVQPLLSSPLGLRP